MNVFEDLVVELKEQNLLEETVIDIAAGENLAHVSGSAPASRDPEPVVYDDGISGFDFSPAAADDPISRRGEGPRYRSPVKPENVRQKAGDKMATLQMVEHLFNAVEREYMRISPNAFDDLPVKKSFHRYDQTSADPESDEYFEAESALVLELEAWGIALAARDKEIPAACVRRYSETAQPPLSPQALFALARFYHSAEFTEQVRAKFDLVITRLFSKIVDGDRRELLCPREEIVRHLKQRYSEWSSSFYPTSADDPDVMLLVLTLEDFIVEAESAADLSELTSGDYFQRICRFKESTGETFLSPQVAAAAVECNIRVAAKVIELIDLERLNADNESILAKYMAVDDRVISEAVGRTLSVEGLLEAAVSIPDVGARQKEENSGADAQTESRPAYKRSRSKTRKKVSNADRSSLLGVNRWMLIATALSVVLSVGVYIWAEYLAGDVVTTVGVKVVDLGDSDLKEYVKSAKISGDMLYAVVSPAFDKLSRGEQESLLKRLRETGVEKGYSRVSLLNLQGRAIGYASEYRLDLAMP